MTPAMSSSNEALKGTDEKGVKPKKRWGRRNENELRVKKSVKFQISKVFNISKPNGNLLCPTPNPRDIHTSETFIHT